MEPIGHEPEFVQGYEVLNLGQVELEKVREDGAHTFATLGNLSVFYFDYFERFVLQLNNWRYCLYPKLSTRATSQLGLPGRNIEMPAYDGTYTIKLNQVMSPAALQNLETIFAGATIFTQEGAPQEFSIRPNDMMMFGEAESQIYAPAQPGVFYERSRVLDTRNHNASTFSAGNSDVKKSKLKMSLNNFKKKFSKKNKVRREPNLNMTQIRDYQAIRTTPANMVNVVDFKRQDIEAAIVATKEIIKKRQGPPVSFKEEMKEKVAGFVDVVKEGVQDMRERIADRHEHEAKTGEKLGIMEIVKGGIMDMRDKLNKKGPLEDGEIEPMDPNEVITVRRTIVGPDPVKPGIVETVKSEYYGLKEKAALRQELSGVPPEKVGILDIVKEGYIEIKERMAAKKALENATVTERVETIVTPGGMETHTTRVFTNEYPQVYESPRTTTGRLKIFDDKYLDQPLHTQPFPITGVAGEEMVQHYSDLARPVPVMTRVEYKEPVSVVTRVEYKELRPEMGIMDKLKANLPFSENSHHLPVKETHVPVGHASGNITDRIKDRIHGTSNVVLPVEPARQEKVGLLNKVQIFMGTKEPDEAEAHSPVKKRELIKAIIKKQPDEVQDQGRLLNIAHAGGLIGIAQAGGLRGLTEIAAPMLMNNKVDAVTQGSALNKGRPGRMDMVKTAFGRSKGKKKENTDKPGAMDQVKAFFKSNGPIDKLESQKKGVVMEQPTVVDPKNMRTIGLESRVYEQPVIERHMPLQSNIVNEVYTVQQESIPMQTTVIQQVQPNVVQEVYQVQNQSIPVQGRIIDRRVESVVNPQVQTSTSSVDQVYESQIAHYEC